MQRRPHSQEGLATQTPTHRKGSPGMYSGFFTTSSTNSEAYTYCSCSAMLPTLGSVVSTNCGTSSKAGRQGRQGCRVPGGRQQASGAVLPNCGHRGWRVLAVAGKESWQAAWPRGQRSARGRSFARFCSAGSHNCSQSMGGTAHAVAAQSRAGRHSQHFSTTVRLVRLTRKLGKQAAQQAPAPCSSLPPCAPTFRAEGNFRKCSL